MPDGEEVPLCVGDDVPVPVAVGLLESELVGVELPVPVRLAVLVGVIDTLAVPERDAEPVPDSDAVPELLAVTAAVPEVVAVLEEVAVGVAELDGVPEGVGSWQGQKRRSAPLGGEPQLPGLEGE